MRKHSMSGAVFICWLTTFGLSLAFGATDRADAAESDVVVPLQIEIPAPEVIPGITHPPLKGVALTLAGTIQLDRAFEGDRQLQAGCVIKQDIRARFCLDAVTWPGLFLNDLFTDDVVYNGNQAIVRYDDNRISQAHVLFPADRFIQVLEHIEKKYGAPTEQELFKTQIPERPPIINTVVRWRSVFGEDKKDLILEVRAHDDTRRTFPDKTHGFIWLYRDGAKPVFRNISVVDLMVMRKRHIGQWPYPVKTE